MTSLFQALANDPIRTLTPYQPGKPIEELERELGITSSIKLASNENPLGASPKAIAAVKHITDHLHIYPDGGAYALKKTTSDHLHVKPEQLTFGNGSENVLELISKAYLNPSTSIVISEYAFITIPLLAKSYGAKVNIASAHNWGHDVHAMLDAIDKETRIVFLVNPNNPTGTYTNQHDFDLLMSSVPDDILVVVDEAYAEYIDQDDYPDTISYLEKYPNLIITRTFSKAHGLAALRLGFAISSPEIADILNRARLPFNVNAAAAVAGCAALLDQAHVQKSVALNNSGMVQLTRGLKALGLTFIPSLGNFITINVGDAANIYQSLLHQGVIVRPLVGYGMPQHIRVTIGTKQENARFLDAITAIMKQTA